MKRTRLFALAGISSMLVAGCVTATLAPGADKVRITNVSAAVAACSAVGNLHVTLGPNGAPTTDPNVELRNQAIGFGGNTVLVTSSTMGDPTEGIAYRCP